MPQWSFWIGALTIAAGALAYSERGTLAVEELDGTPLTAALAVRYELLDANFTFQCTVTPSSLPGKGPLSAVCQDAWATADFTFPETFGEPACQIQTPGASMNYTEITPSGISANASTMDDVANQLPCAPVLLGHIQLYTPQKRTEWTLLNDVEVTNYRPEHDGLLYIYGISADEDARFLTFRKFDSIPQAIDGEFREIKNVLKLDDFMGGLDDWSAARKSQRPKTYSVGTNQWNRAAIALGRANAVGCGEFTLSGDLSATCGDGSRWDIDIINMSAYHL